MGLCMSLPGPKYEEYDWVELPADARTAAETLGYTKKAWDKGKDVEYDEYDWEDLPEEQKQAATILGYDEQTWNK
eukprot:CAMPEP_0197247678 /NCGR_PEP_ID=MMETSP1429-20130617/30883_1 /TAXON_ID=49237 /ORGANISM="Chaetoceros  sp., Strain UNC1202" /LENGTH=74 /DNA_ID=CAMNT_0042708641 /DNA_START=63 /DNA_END=287 /DNA_ORIENTATION=+